MLLKISEVLALDGSEWFIEYGFKQRMKDVSRQLVADSVDDAEFLAYLADGVSPRDSSEKPYAVENGVAVLNLHGPMTKERSFWSYYFGGCAAMDLLDQMNMAYADADAPNGILFDIASPGGQANSMGPLVARIREMLKEGSKSVQGFASGMCCSAAYGVGSQVSKLYGARDSQIGSLGTYLSLWDSSEYYAKMGLKPVVVKAGEFKGIGAEGTKITADQIAVLQKTVDAFNGLFMEDVANSPRKLSLKDVKALNTGETWVGAEAVPLKLIDGVKTRAEVISAMSNSGKNTLDKSPTRLYNLSSSHSRTGEQMSRFNPFKAMADAHDLLADAAEAGDNADLPVATANPNAAQQRTAPATNTGIIATLTGTRLDANDKAILEACAAANITTPAQLEQLRSFSQIGEQHLTQLRSDAKAEAVRAYGQDKGVVIGKQVDNAGYEDVKSLLDAWQTQADEKFKTNRTEGGTRVSVGGTMAPVMEAVRTAGEEDPQVKTTALLSKTHLGRKAAELAARKGK